MSHLFDPFTTRSITMRNRVGIAPMCQYSSTDGFANDWHVVHLGSFASGGAGLVINEATAVEARGRISPHDLGIWADAHIERLAQITHFIRGQGAVAAIQLAHAGRKASTARPWDGGKAVDDAHGGWEPVGPSALPFSDTYRVPHELSVNEIREVQQAFRDATLRALEAGFQIAELHAAHGYLMHNFMSPLSNQRTDQYGGSFENRVRFTLETARIVREVWPEELPLYARISCTDWTDGGWTLEESVELSRLLHAEGVDLIDCSSGGNVAGAEIPVGAGYQVPFAERIRREANVPTAAVGLITEPAHADEIVRNNRADVVLLAREMLRDPHWAFRAARALKQEPDVPAQYARAV